MSWKNAVNSALRTTGYQIVRAGPEPRRRPQATGGPATDAAGQQGSARGQAVEKELVRAAPHPDVDRLVRQPVFVMSTVRSGSTLLRVLLNAHSMIHAPHELHVRRLRVQLTTGLAKKSMKLLGHNEADLEHLLWDRVLQRELMLSGKQVFVDKTPSNTFAYERLRTVWPDARFIFLLRHPASISASWIEANRNNRSREEAITDSLRYMRALERAKQALPGLTVRYEDLTADPAAVTQRICEFVGVPWESGMLDYGGNQKFVKGVGDWSDNIRSGRVQKGRELPADDQVPGRLRPMSRRWGYLPAVGGSQKDEDTTQGEVPVDDSETDEAMSSSADEA